MATSKKQTKQDLESKIAELEAKIDKLSTMIDSKSDTTKSVKVKTKQTEAAKPKGTLPKGFDKPKPAETPKPKPAEAAKPNGTLPKGFDKPKPAETPKPKPAEAAKPNGTLPKGFDKPKPAETPKPKPAEKTSQVPATVQEVLEDAYRAAPMTDFHQYRAKVTGYTPAPNRYFVRLTAPVGKVPTTDWNQQKAVVTGYTQPSNQYFATRQRLAYHPADKAFGSFSGTNLTVENVATKVQQIPTPEPKPKKGTLPKGF